MNFTQIALGASASKTFGPDCHSIYSLYDNIIFFPLLLRIRLTLMSMAHIIGGQVILAQINMAQIRIAKMIVAQKV